MTLKRWKITIEYDGGAFCGWQRQNDNIPSVQACIESAIHGFCQQDIRVHAAGRTDTGVHAKGQIAHFDIDYGERNLSGFEIAKAINAHLKDHRISIIHAEEVSEAFHARFEAKNKLYCYRIIQRRFSPALDEGRAWHVKKNLDVEAMRLGAQHLLGHHDFSSFRASYCQAKSPMKTLDRVAVTVVDYDDFGGRDIQIMFEGRSFLHHQVRNMAGTLKLVGEGKWTPQNVKTALDAKDRTKGGPTAPACGLCLIKIDYDVE